MIKIKLEPNEVELALNIASKRYIGNLRMGKTFSYGYTKGIKSQLTDGVLGALGEVAYAKATNSFYNDKDFNFTIMGSFIYNDDLPPEKLTDFGYTQRPPAYKIELKELNPRLE
jgi:hypothetical protein